jgi:hypothetical protein
LTSWSPLFLVAFFAFAFAMSPSFALCRGDDGQEIQALSVPD